jgi:hypothetical protein
MAETSKEDSEKGSCCSGGGGKCCGCKCVKTLITLLLGAVIGYLIGGHCAYKSSTCPMTGMMTPASTPQK